MPRILLFSLLGLAVAVVVLELVAMFKGFNGTSLAAALAILGAIVGWILRSLFRVKF